MTRAHERGKTWEEGLSQLMSDNGGPGCENPGSHVNVKRSMDRMLLADKIVGDHFPEYRALLKPTGPSPRLLSA